MKLWTMDFYGRSSLLEALDRELVEVGTTGQGRMIAMRGRRQVGKSRLVTHFTETRNVPYLYTTAVKNATPFAQLERLAVDASSSARPLPDTDALFTTPPTTWDDAFRRLALSLRSTPAIVVLDEFPWAVQADPTLEGTLQNAWDRALEALPILLILVGSDVTMMERLSEHDRPLFGRAGIMTVRPFNPGECAALMSDAPALSIFDAYLITGGYPRLLSRLARAESAMRFVVDQLTDEASDLAIMAQLSLDAEFPLDSQARQVLSAIGYAELGTMSFSRVTQGLPGTQATAQTAVTRALRLLVDIKRVVAIDVPVGAPKNTRMRRYRVDDPYLRFWFRFVEPQLANMSRGRSDIAIQAFQRGWQAWRGKTMEPVVREAVLRLAPSLDRLRDVESVGGWWNRNNSVEVDLVGASRHGDIRTIGSIKWRERAPFDVRDRHELDAARHAVSGAERAQLIAVSPAGLAHDVDVDMVLTADDLLAAWHA